MERPKILVVGSLVMDLITSTWKIPNQGETVLGQSFSTATGGKGANQGVQASKLGADVTMVGRVGNDIYGEALIQALIDSGVDVANVIKSNDDFSAIGNVILNQEEDGNLNNRIIVVPGANMSIKIEDIKFLEYEISKYNMVMLQLEIPMEINIKVAEYATKNNIPVMLNSAPYQDMPKELLKNITYISPNETEAKSLTGIALRTKTGKIDIENIYKAIKVIHEMGVKNVIITLGDGGAIVSNGSQVNFKESVKVNKVEDPTAAGDSFVGAFCTGICLGLNNENALIFANSTAAITVSKKGAQPSLPSLKEVLLLMKKNGEDTTTIEKNSLNIGG